jgi:hypothetical protein
MGRQSAGISSQLNRCRSLLAAAFVATSFAFVGQAIAGPAADEMNRYDEAAQREILGIEIRSSGNRCQQVDRMMHMGEYRSRDIYAAHCVDALFDYAVFMSYRAQLYGIVRLCIYGAQGGGIRCWRPIASAAPPVRPARTDQLNE